MSRERIAIVGGGVAGLSAAFLLSKKFDVTIFEASDRLGGHAWPYRIREGGREFDVDTAFLIFNSHSYPNFLQFLKMLGLSHIVTNSNMSIGLSSLKNKLAFSINGGKRDLLSYLPHAYKPDFLRLLLEIRRFRAASSPENLAAETGQKSLAEFLKAKNFSAYFAENFAYPLGASVWSLPREGIKNIPASLFFSFFNNHKILKNEHGARWQTLTGTSAAYLQKFKELFSGKILYESPVISLRRRTETCEIFVKGNAEPQTFDRVVLATHSDDSLALLESPTPQESKILGAWKYLQCETVLHSDESAVPRIAGKWASWNVVSPSRAESPLTVSYHLNRIQNLPTKKNYFLGWGDIRLQAGTEICRFALKHPSFNAETEIAKAGLEKLQGPRVFFCGSYAGNGFHEDAVKSAFAVAEKLGVEI